MWRNLPTGRQVGRRSRLKICLLKVGLPLKRFKVLCMYYVYAIKSVERNYIYVGLTDNFERRFSEHNGGRNKTTKPYLPFELILKEKFSTRILARQREKYLKSGTGKEFLKSLL
jgi:putative endonuclease